MNLQTEFSQQLALALYESTEEFPVDLEEAYMWLGYSRKDAAKRKLVNNFIEGVDYTFHRSVESLPDKGSSHKDQIKLTTNCFKELKLRYNLVKCIILIKNHVFNYRIFRNNYKMRYLWNIP